MAKNRAVILATNHPTAFLEPSIMACFLPRPIYFLVRGNFFNNPFYGRLLLSMNMLPIYRRKDGEFQDLKRNFSLLDHMYQKLHNNEVLMILAEGNMKHEKRLRPLQKGTARLAFGAFKEYEKQDIQIVPVGVNFDFATRFRQTGMIAFGRPMELEDYLELYEENPNKAIRQFTDDLRDRLQEYIITIEKEEDVELVEQLFTLYRNEHPHRFWPIVDTDNKPLEAEICISRFVNLLDEEKKIAFKQQVGQYRNVLQEHGLADMGVAQSAAAAPVRTVGIIIGAVPFAIGYVFNIPPALLTKFIIDKYVEIIEFVGPIKMAVGTFSYFFYYVFWALLLLLNGISYGVLVLPVLLGLGYFAIAYHEFFQKWKAAFRFRQLSQAVQDQLRTKRSEIFSYLPC